MNKIESIVSIIKSWDDNDIINAWNRTCEENNDPDSMIYCTDDFNELFYGKKPLEIAEMIEGNDFYSGDEYFTFNNYGNIMSFSFLDDDNSPVDYDEIAEYLIDYGDSDTNEVDTDKLVEDFLVWFKSEYPDTDIEKVKYYFEEEEVEVDLLVDDWVDAADTILNYLNGPEEE